jgi:hypothetical protein
MKKYLPIFSAVVVAVAPVVAQPAQDFVAANPTLATALGAVGCLLAYLTPSPVKRK